MKMQSGLVGLKTLSQRRWHFEGLLEKDLKVTSVYIQLLRDDKTHIFLPLCLGSLSCPPPPNED